MVSQEQQMCKFVLPESGSPKIWYWPWKKKTNNAFFIYSVHRNRSDVLNVVVSTIAYSPGVNQREKR